MQVVNLVAVVVRGGREPVPRIDGLGGGDQKLAPRIDGLGSDNSREPMTPIDGLCGEGREPTPLLQQHLGSGTTSKKTFFSRRATESDGGDEGFRGCSALAVASQMLEAPAVAATHQETARGNLVQGGETVETPVEKVRRDAVSS
jgi:hypothetical protein